MSTPIKAQHSQGAHQIVLTSKPTFRCMLKCIPIAGWPASCMCGMCEFMTQRFADIARPKTNLSSLFHTQSSSLLQNLQQGMYVPTYACSQEHQRVQRWDAHSVHVGWHIPYGS